MHVVLRANLLALVVASVTCMACGSADNASVSGDGSAQQLTLSFAPAVSVETLAFVVDDTVQGAALRTALADAFAKLDTVIAEKSSSCAAPPDPAAWRPIDRSVVIVHPSARGDARFSSPANLPALRWHEANRSELGRSAWLAAVKEALAASPAADGAPFQALATFADANALLMGTRSATTDGERALLAALPPGPSVLPISLAVATEDASPDDPSQYLGQFPFIAVLPATTPMPDVSCSRTLGAATSRYRGIGGGAQLWPCTQPDFFDVLDSDCTFTCLPRPIATTDQGAVCVVTGRFDGTAPCPTDLGWLDPMSASGRAARVDHTSGGDQRVCEVQQLVGDALTSCQQDLACTDCTPGWCATEVPSLVPANRCTVGPIFPPFRFVSGANWGPATATGVTCVKRATSELALQRDRMIFA